MSVGSELISRILGYTLTTGNFSESSPNLTQRVAILAEANTANQSDLDTDGTEITSALQAGQLFGFGSPIHQIMRILRPNSGGGIDGIVTKVYAQEEAGGATAKSVEVVATGTATGNGTHTLRIGGRTGLEGSFYDINIVSGDGADEIHAKIEDAVNNVLASPVSAASTDYEATLTTKWKGLTANDLTVTVDTNDNDLGITYAVTVTAAGSGTPSIAGALSQFGNDWVTIVVNGYGTVTSVMTALQDFNGRPDPTNPTGRFASIVFKPFIAITGSVADDPSSVTDSRLDDVTIAIAPAPGSEGFPFEAAANMCVLFARKSQDTPNLDVGGSSYPDMPVPVDGDIGTMADYTSRDLIVKKGCSTVMLVSGRYQVQDFVTTYHKLGEVPAQFRYCRNLMLDFNVRYGYYLLELINVLDHSISNDADVVTAQNVVKPKQWKGILNSYADDLAVRGLIADADFMKDSITVGISTVNPDRFETFFRYKRTGVVRIASTTAEAGFNFGSTN